jgi:2-polyprenyl-3-methyl-5-hydroxy-6-metoxy-1,4-benzoquinol methylase
VEGTQELANGAREGQQTFAERLVDLSNAGSMALMISIGHRTGLFDTMASLPPATSHELAANAGLDERYVREWLGAMTTGRVVEHDPQAMTFALPADHAACLTRAAGPANAAVAFQLASMFGRVEDQIVDCFRRGGGLPYSQFPRFQAIQAEISWAGLDATLVDAVLPCVPGLVQRLRAGCEMADIGCGSGHAVNLMAEAFPASRFVGFDLADDALASARAEAERKQLTNARFEIRDAAALAEREQFDFITTFDAVHDQARPDLVLRAIAGALRPGGTYLCVEIGASSVLADNMDLPWAPGMYTASCMHCMTVSLAAGGLGLGAMWGEETARQMLAHAGFTGLEVKRLAFDPFNKYYIATKA